MHKQIVIQHLKSVSQTVLMSMNGYYSVITVIGEMFLIGVNNNYETCIVELYNYVRKHTISI